MERTLGYWLRKARIDRKFPQNYVSIHLQISKSTLCKYEKDKLLPNVRTLIQISSLYKMSLDRLTGILYNKIALKNINKIGCNEVAEAIKRLSK